MGSDSTYVCPVACAAESSFIEGTKRHRADLRYTNRELRGVVFLLLHPKIGDQWRMIRGGEGGGIKNDSKIEGRDVGGG